MAYNINEKDIQRIIKRLDKMQDSLNAIRNLLVKVHVKPVRKAEVAKFDSVAVGMSSGQVPLVVGSSREKNKRSSIRNGKRLDIVKGHK